MVSVPVGSVKADFQLYKIFRGQERKGKFSAERNGKFSFANFHFSIRTGKENSRLKHGGPKCDDEEITIASKSNQSK